MCHARYAGLHDAQLSGSSLKSCQSRPVRGGSIRLRGVLYFDEGLKGTRKACLHVLIATQQCSGADHWPVSEYSDLSVYHLSPCQVVTCSCNFIVSGLTPVRILCNSQVISSAAVTQPHQHSWMALYGHGHRKNRRTVRGCCAAELVGKAISAEGIGHKRCPALQDSLSDCLAPPMYNSPSA